MQTTADGVPVLWHDDYIVSVPPSTSLWGLGVWRLVHCGRQHQTCTHSLTCSPLLARPQVYGDSESSPVSKQISELSYAEFCQLAPINAAGGAAPATHFVQTAWLDGQGAAAEREPSPERGMVRGDSSDSLASIASNASAASSRSARLMRKLHNHLPATAGAGGRPRRALPGPVSRAGVRCSAL